MYSIGVFYIILHPFFVYQPFCTPLKSLCPIQILLFLLFLLLLYSFKVCDSHGMSGYWYTSPLSVFRVCVHLELNSRSFHDEYWIHGIFFGLYECAICKYSLNCRRSCKILSLFCAGFLVHHCNIEPANVVM